MPICLIPETTNSAGSGLLQQALHDQATDVSVFSDAVLLKIDWADDLAVPARGA
jgi:hypothetical protein